MDLRQFEQAQQVGNMAAAFADDRRQLLLRVAEFVHQPLIARRFLERVEIRALDVLNQRQLQRLLVRSPRE
jgi:hypothetical protein